MQGSNSVRNIKNSTTVKVEPTPVTVHAPPFTFNSSGQLMMTPDMVQPTGVYKTTVANVALALSPVTNLVTLVNPIGSGKSIRLRRVEVSSNGTGVSLTIVSVGLRRISFTSNPTGTPLAPSKKATSQPNATGKAYASYSGTVTTDAMFYAFPVVCILTAIGGVVPSSVEYHVPKADGWDTLAEGEGFQFFQSGAGAATEKRFVTINFAWEE